MQNLFYEEPRPENRYDLFKDDPPFQKQKLRRSNTDKILGGICGGLAKYYGIAPIIFRLLFPLAVFLGGIGIIIYLILFLIIPKSEIPSEEVLAKKLLVHNKKSVLGIILIFIGFYSILMPEDYFPFLFYFQIPNDVLFPFFIILLGIWIQKNHQSIQNNFREISFLRPITGRLFLGVCVGLAEYLQTYTIIIRLVFVVISFATMGFGIVLYFIIALLSKTEERWEIEK